MRPLLLAGWLFSLSIPARSQHYHSPYENDYLGWQKIYHFRGGHQPLKVDEKNYSTHQLAWADSFANWMQASYLPKGCLGDVRRYATPKKGLYSDRYNEGVPPSVGANASLFIFLKQVNGKWVPENNLGYHWTIAANEIPLGDREIDFNTSKVCLFTIAEYDMKQVKEDPNAMLSREYRLYDLSDHPVLKKYVRYSTPAMNTASARRSEIILTRSGKSPFVHVTIGEALQFAEDAFPVKYAEEKQTAVEQNSYSKPQLDLALSNLDKKFTLARKTLGLLREKYRTRLNEWAYLTYGGYSINGLANGTDIFTGAAVAESRPFNLQFPLYRVDPALEPLCKTDQPQWIRICWYGGTMDEQPFRHLYESVINNFDFDYVYRFFFEPEKVRNVPYKPLRSLTWEPKPETAPVSATMKKMVADPAIFFYDDFSGYAAGKRPAGWNSDMNVDGEYTSIVELPSTGSKWMRIRGHENCRPVDFPKLLPADFEISFDAAVPANIPWGSKALEFFLGTGTQADQLGSYLQLRLRAGFDGRPGEVTLAGNKFGNDYFSTGPLAGEAQGFSNNQPINIARVRLLKQGEALKLWINDQLIGQVPKAIPAGTRFQYLLFRQVSSDLPVQQYFITKFRVSRL